VRGGVKVEKESRREKAARAVKSMVPSSDDF
jgi:hypothetical protein